MPSRQTYRDVLQLRADLWRIPLVLCAVTLLLFAATVQGSWPSASRAVW